MVTVYPTNLFGANTASNNIYYIANVSDANSCVGNQPGDIRGTNTVMVNPRPTATLISTNLANYRYAATPCNYPTNYTITNILTGIGPWTVNWLSNNAAVTQTVGSGPGPFPLIMTVYPTNSFGANAASNNIYYIASLSDSNSCFGNEPGDIRGTNTVMVNPRPCVQVYGTNAVCSGSSYSITNILTGVGPWNVVWTSNDVTLPTQFVNVPGSGPYTNLYTVIPTSTQSNAAVGAVYYVKSLTDTNGCAGNLPGDLKGTNVLTINPRPTVQVFGTNTICNGDPYFITNILTGFGPWIVGWSSNGVLLPAFTVNTNTAGPYTNYFTVTPTSTLLNSAVTNLFYVASLTDSNSCGSLPGDLKGTNCIVVNPLPTVVLFTNIGFSATNHYVFKNNNANAFNNLNLLQSATNILGTNYVRVLFSTNWNGPTKFSFKTNRVTLQITNRATLTGIPNWDVTWRQIGADANGAFSVTTDVTANYATSNAVKVWNVDIYTNTPGTNFTFTLLTVSNANASCAIVQPVTNVVRVFVNALLGADVSVDGLSTICNGDKTTIAVYLSGTPPWKVWWADSGTYSNATSSPLIRTVSPTNIYPNIHTNYYYWVTNLADLYSTNSMATNADNFAQVTVDPLPSAPPQSLGDKTNCLTVAVPLFVSVPPGFTADWYSTNIVATNYLVAAGTNVLVPTVPAAAGTNTYYVLARYDDPDVPATCYSAFTNITLVTVACTNIDQLTSTNLSLNGSNAVIKWSGDYVLLHTTNLAPTYWVQVTQGGVGINFWTNSTRPPQPPVNFFRLWAPTNWPYTNYFP